MKFEWDNNKQKLNLNLHGFDFKHVMGFDWNTAEYRLDTRFTYGENRVIATGMFMGRVTVMVFTLREDRLRIISWRKANQREVRGYGH